MTKINQLSPFGFNRPEDCPGFLLWQTVTVWQRSIKKALEPYGVSHAQFVVMAFSLWFEKKGQKPTQIQVAQLSKLDKMTVSKSLKALTKLGYVDRAESLDDNRAKWIILTETGKSLTEKLVSLVEEIDQDFFGVLSHCDYQLLISSLQTITSRNNL